MAQDMDLCTSTTSNAREMNLMYQNVAIIKVPIIQTVTTTRMRVLSANVSGLC